MRTRSTFLPFASPEVGDAELAEIKEALTSGWVTRGPKTREFEEKFAVLVGATQAVAVTSCTAAMHLALEAVGLRRGDVVLTTPYAFAASAEVVRYFDAIPVFVDVDPETFNIDPEQLKAAADALSGDNPEARAPYLPPRLGRSNSAIRNSQSAIGPPKAILPVHIAGLPADLDEIYAVAAKHGLAVVDDAAHAFPSTYKGHAVGSRVTSHEPRVPALTCFSFYATKTITTGEGGMITTDDEALADRCRVMALHGISKDAWRRYTAEGSWYYEIVAPGYKYNMGDVTAAMGLAQLEKAEQMWKRRVEIAGRYNEAFREVEQLQVPADREDCRHSWHLYMLRLNLEMLSIDRARFIEELKQRSIGTSVHFIPLHIHPYYRETYGYRPEDFPVAYGEYLREISLPIYSKMTDSDVQDVIAAVMEVVRKHSR
jgi:dTDP-4-amino-4,6-dideoxygalactose transaminase